MPTLKVDPVTQRLRTVAQFNGKIIGEPTFIVQAPFGSSVQDPKVESPSPTRSGAIVTTCVCHTTCTQPDSTDESLTRPFDINVQGVVDDSTNPVTLVRQHIDQAAQWFPSTPPGSDMATAVVMDVATEPLS